LSPSLYDATIGGSVDCRTTGSYDAESQVLQQVGICHGTGLFIGSDPSVPVPFVQSSLAGSVSNSGRPLSGAFSMFGSIPTHGIDDVTLLASGTLLDVWYGGFEDESGYAAGLFSLIDLHFVAEPINHLGNLLLWQSFSIFSEWGECTGPQCQTWITSASDLDNYSGTTYGFLDRSVVVPEPGTLLLLSGGLVGLAAIRRRRIGE
jgi:hypothetical protein